MYSEYDGQTYYPKYAEDLVHLEVLLLENAPEEFKDPAKLWNSVEMAEKSDKAQLQEHGVSNCLIFGLMRLQFCS